MAEADVPEVRTYDVPSRLLGKDGRPTPHVNAEKYNAEYPESINNTDAFFGKVSNHCRLFPRFGTSCKARWRASADSVRTKYAPPAMPTRALCDMSKAHRLSALPREAMISCQAALYPYLCLELLDRLFADT